MSVPLFDTATPLAPLRDELVAKLGEVLDSGPLHPRPGGRGLRARVRGLPRSPPRDRRGQRHRRADARAAGARRRPRRRGDRALVHVLRVGRGDPADRRAARLLRRRSRRRSASRQETVQAAITPRTKAVIVVHLFGNVAPVAEIEALGVPVVEDAAQAAGRARGRRAPRRLARHDRDLLVLPLQEPRRVRRRRRRRDERRRARRARADAALPRLARQGELRARRLQLAPRRDAGRAAADHAAAPRPLVRRPPRRRRRLRGRRAWARSASCRSRPRAARPRGISTSCATRSRTTLAAAFKAADIGHKAYYRVPTHRQPAMREYAAGGLDLPVTDELARTHLAIPMSPVLEPPSRSPRWSEAAHAVAANRMR